MKEKEDQHETMKEGVGFKQSIQGRPLLGRQIEI